MRQGLLPDARRANRDKQKRRQDPVVINVEMPPAKNLWRASDGAAA